MNVAVIGAGFGGLSAAYYLSKEGVDVTVFESGGNPGGLAVGFKENDWEWSLEKHYHHLFTSDGHVINLAEEVGEKIIFKRPVSSTLVDGNIYQLDSPLSLLKFKKLNLVDRVRTGIVVAFLKINPFWKPLERVSSEDFLIKTMGGSSWKYIWKPLFEKKFGGFVKNINAAWFWARIKKRSSSLGYPEGGFLKLAEKIESEVKKHGGKFIYKTKVAGIEKSDEEFIVKTENKEYVFDKVIVTLPSKSFLDITSGLPPEYVSSLRKLKGLGTINMVLSLKEKYLKSGNYWLNINDEELPFLAIVEHTNFMDKRYYNDENLLYIANYLPVGHKYFSYSDSKLYKEYYPYLKRIVKDFNKELINKIYVFRSPFTQPVVELNHSELVPPFETPIKDLYLCNIQQVYPWDRGTNYAVENGKIVASLVLKSN